MSRSLRYTIALLSLLLSGAIWAHTLLLAINVNDDRTITVEGMFSSGDPAANVEIRLEATSGEVLSVKTADKDGKATFNQPSQPYYVVLDGGQGHIVEEEGPLRE
jgi:hypothetical protein